MRLIVRPLAFTLVIADNGCGLHTTKSGPPDPGRISSGHGLGNLEQRLRASGGSCVITSEPGQGTRVELNVDLTAPRSPEVVTGKIGFPA